MTKNPTTSFSKCYIVIYLFIISIKSQEFTSPCPDILTYENNIQEGSDRWYGVIHLRSDVTLNGVWVEILLDRPSHLLGNWFGQVSSNDNTLFIIRNQTHVLRPNKDTTVKFFVKYSVTKQIPIVKEIYLNGVQICPVASVTTTSTTTTTTRKPAVILPSSNVNPFQNSNRQSTRQPIPDPKFTIDYTRATALDNSGQTCGIAAIRPRPLIVEGEPTVEGQWPWHAAIYRTVGVNLVYACGGSLVSFKHIITAAHCVTRQKSNQPIHINTLVIYLGKHILNNWSRGTQTKRVSYINIHPEYKSSNNNNDVAVLYLEDEIQYTDYVRPVCLWQEQLDLSSLLGRNGVVVGWGFDKTGFITENLMMTEMPVVSRDTCLESFPEFYWSFTSSNTYCAGYKNGTSVCNGDSGGGMVFALPNTNPPVWQLRGVVSISVALQDEFICDPKHYAVFTDLAKHKAWIEQIIPNTLYVNRK